MADNDQPVNHWQELPEKIANSTALHPLDKDILLGYWSFLDGGNSTWDAVEKFNRLAFDMRKSMKGEQGYQ